ncbi:MAG: hypothetical protein ACRDI0_00875 [Actinomycetota bacterium]
MGAVALVLLALMAPAFAKGPTKATIEGDGLSAPITLDGNGEPGAMEEVARLAQFSGIFHALGKGLPADRPAGELGPKLTITWFFPPDSEVLEELYPYASGGAVTYTEPGQTLYGHDLGGGWYRADPALKEVLVEAGIPELPVRSSVPSPAVSLAALAIAALAVLAARRLRPAPAT